MKHTSRLPLASLLAAVLTTGLVTGACGTSTPTYGADVWAVVDGREIRKADVEKAYRSLVPPATVPPAEEDLLLGQLNALDELITQDILVARARAAGLQVSESEVDTSFAERRGETTEAAMDQQLSQRSLTRDDVRDALRRELFVKKLLERDVVARVNVTDADVEAFFNANRGRFNLAEAQYRIAQIVVTPQADPQTNNRRNDDARTAQEARRKIEGLIAQLKGGADFGQVAAEYSEDPQSAQQGGDLGFIAESQLRQAPAPLRDVVLQMQPGNVNTLAIGGGYTIVLLVAKEPAGQRELSSPGVREQIKDGLVEREDRLLRASYIAAARHGAVVDHRISRSIVDRYSAAAPPAVTPAAPGK
jgi:peptidyl-prolyl cis-trans isomerase SurA